MLQQWNVGKQNFCLRRGEIETPKNIMKNRAQKHFKKLQSNSEREKEKEGEEIC